MLDLDKTMIECRQRMDEAAEILTVYRTALADIAQNPQSNDWAQMRAMTAFQTVLSGGKKGAKMKAEVDIDGKAFDLLCTVAEKGELFKALDSLYCEIWTEACYDAKNSSTQAMCRNLLPAIQLANRILQFKK